MTNKDSKIEEFKNRVITPELTKLALDHLPHNFVVQTEELLRDLKDSGEIDRIYSKRYITQVKTENAFNGIIMRALVHVGLENKKAAESFGIPNKKASATI